MNFFNFFILTFLIATQNVHAVAPVRTSFIPFEIDRHMMIAGQLRECLDSGDAVITSVAWGSEPDEVFKALARENRLPEADFDKYQGPFKTFGEYSRGIAAHRDLYIQLLQKKGFSVLPFLTRNAKTGALEPNQDPNDLMTRMDDSLSAMIMDLAHEQGWTTITAQIEGIAYEPDSTGCRRP